MCLGKRRMAPTVKNRETDLGRSAAGTSARTSGRLALLSWVLSTLFAAAALVIMFIGWSAEAPTSETMPVLNPVLLAAVFSTVGALIASRRSENLLGWLMCAEGLILALNALTDSYAVYALYSYPEPLPGAELAAWANVFTGNIGIFPFLLLLFPDGRLPSPRWLPVFWFVVGTTLVEVAFWAFAPGRFPGWPSAHPCHSANASSGLSTLSSVPSARHRPRSVWHGHGAWVTGHKRGPGLTETQPSSIGASFLLSYSLG
jgi:hypothetical protein